MAGWAIIPNPTIAGFEEEPELPFKKVPNRADKRKKAKQIKKMFGQQRSMNNAKKQRKQEKK